MGHKHLQYSKIVNDGAMDQVLLHDSIKCVHF